MAASAFRQENTAQKEENRYLQPLGHLRIIGNDHVPWYPGEYRGKKPQNEGQRADLSK